MVGMCLKLLVTLQSFQSSQTVSCHGHTAMSWVTSRPTPTNPDPPAKSSSFGLLKPSEYTWLRFTPITLDCNVDDGTQTGFIHGSTHATPLPQVLVAMPMAKGDLGIIHSLLVH